MSDTRTISYRDARRIALSHQGLLGNDVFGRGKNGTAKAISHLGYVQIDSISVVQRAHHHVLRSRVANYTSGFLQKLQVPDRAIFEYWSHAAAYLPVDDYRFAIPIMNYYREKKDRWPKSDDDIKAHVLDRVREEGGLMARDFKAPDDHNSSGWWEWKPAKWALQRLFMEGHLLVTQRKGFQRIYDLPERILPSHISTDEPTRGEYIDFLIESYLRAHGLGTAPMMAYQRQGMTQPVEKRLAALAKKGELIKVRVGKNGSSNYYTRPGVLEHIPARVMKTVSILSPFDNAVINRQRLLEIFDFNFLLECYVPESKRIYGYFSLPILYGDTFVGRVDCKTDRKKKQLNIISLYVEQAGLDAQFADQLATAILEFAEFNACETIFIRDTDPNKWKKMIDSSIANLDPGHRKNGAARL